MKRVLIAITFGLMTLWFEGCGGLFPKPIPSRLFTLSSLPSTGADTDHSGQISLGIGPVRFPGYLDRQELLTRVAPNRFDLLAHDRWAEPLDENFTRVMTQNLSLLLHTDQIVVYPWPMDKKPHYRVEIEVLRFESNSAGEGQLSARWTIIDEICKGAPNLNESHLSRPAKEKSTDASVSALSETVADLSREIAKTVMAIDRQRET
jgi:uncharacterized protein